jgi:hypothetical protein
MKEKNIIKNITFDDRNLPINTLSVEETERIEKIAMPLLKEALEKLRLEKPHLFKSYTPEKIFDK